MKCLHVLPMNKLSGAEKLALLLCKNLKRYEPIVVCGGNNLKEVFEKNTIKSYSLSFKKKDVITCARLLRNIIRDNEIMIVHAHDNIASIIAYLTKKLYRLEVKIVSHIHSCYKWLEDGRSIVKKIDDYFRNRYDLNIACGDIVYNYYLENSNINNDKTVVLSNAIDIENIQSSSFQTNVYEEFNIPKDKIILGYIGRVTEYKGLVQFIKMLSKRKNEFSNCCMLIVGSGDQEDYIKYLVKELDIDNMFIFTGFQQDVYAFYPLIDIFLLPSTNEGLPMVILEAMSFKIPVVSMDVGSINEVISHGENGLLIRKGDYNLFIQSLLELINDKNRRLKFGSEAYEKIASNYNIKEYARHAENIYNTLLSTNK